MAEEPVREGEGKEGEEGYVSPGEKAGHVWATIRERFARGGFFALAVFFVIGVVFGVSAKSIAARSITIGYWDYQVSPREISAVNMNAVQQKLVAAQAEEARKQEEALKAAQESAETGVSTDVEEGGEDDAGTEELPPLPPAPAPPEGVPGEQ